MKNANRLHEGIVAGRLSDTEYADNFADIHPPLSPAQALVEAERCYFCHDAPCISACPTAIDIPSFIRKIATGNLEGSAKTILEQNIMGGMCARVCPTEVLCEEACVRNTHEHQPVRIGLLQRRATDHAMTRGTQFFSRGADSGYSVAIVGGGPAGLSCAHRLAMLGHKATIYESRRKPGGLNEYGIAAYKTPNDFARREVEYILAIGGIDIVHGAAVGEDLPLSQLRKEHDAVFLGFGLGGVRGLGFDDGDLSGVENAVDFIARLRQTSDLSTLAVGRRVVVIGGGMTAVDAASQAGRLGAEDVTIVYRRGPAQMPASGKEMDFVRTSGVRVKFNAAPKKLIGRKGALSGVEFEYTAQDEDGALRMLGETFVLPADMLLKAVGQRLVRDPASEDDREAPAFAGDKISVDEEMKTSLDNVWAGGDCTAGADDLTVSAVAHGKTAAQSIDRFLRAQRA